MLSAQNPMLSAKNPMLSANSDVGPPMSTDRYQLFGLLPTYSTFLEANFKLGIASSIIVGMVYKRYSVR